MQATHQISSPTGAPYARSAQKMTIGERWEALAPYFLSIARIAAAIMFILAGTMKLFGFPAGMPPGSEPIQVMSQIWIGGVMEVVGGGLILLGLFTRPVAFLLAGEMAVAYWQFHAPSGPWPILNGGVGAALYAFFFLYLSAAGGGAWSLDRWLRGR